MTYCTCESVDTVRIEYEVGERDPYRDLPDNIQVYHVNCGEHLLFENPDFAHDIASRLTDQHQQEEISALAEAGERKSFEVPSELLRV